MQYETTDAVNVQENDVIVTIVRNTQTRGAEERKVSWY